MASHCEEGASKVYTTVNCTGAWRQWRTFEGSTRKQYGIFKILRGRREAKEGNRSAKTRETCGTRESLVGRRSKYTIILQLHIFLIKSFYFSFIASLHSISNILIIKILLYKIYLENLMINVFFCMNVFLFRNFNFNLYEKI